MDKFAKLVDGRPEFAPKNMDNICNFDLSEELMREYGYKRYVEGTKEPDKKYHESYEETEEDIIQVFTEFTPEEYEEAAEEEARRERERKDQMTLTPSDVERALYYGLQMDFDDLKTLISTVAPTVDLKGLAIEFRAKDFYRGAVDKNNNRIVDMIGLLLGLNSDDLDYLFEHKQLSPEAIEKAWNHLHPQPEPVDEGGEEEPVDEGGEEEPIEE